MALISMKSLNNRFSFASTSKKFDACSGLISNVNLLLQILTMLDTKSAEEGWKRGQSKCWNFKKQEK